MHPWQLAYTELHPLKLDGDNVLHRQWLSCGLFNLAQILYRGLSRDPWSTTKIQDQWVKGQGHSVETLFIAKLRCFFTALHVMQPRYGEEISVCPSVRPSVRLSHAWIVTKRWKDLSRFIYSTKEHLSLFSEKKNGWWGATPSTWNFGSTDPR